MVLIIRCVNTEFNPSSLCCTRTQRVPALRISLCDVIAYNWYFMLGVTSSELRFRPSGHTLEDMPSPTADCSQYSLPEKIRSANNDTKNTIRWSLLLSISR